MVAMQKVLDGKQLASFVKQRQAQQVRALRQAHGIQLRLAIILTVDNPVINVYVRVKQKYAADLGVEVDVHRVAQAEVPDLLKKLNASASVHGIIIQLPLEDPAQTEELVNQVAPGKDVDALGAKAAFEPATPMAIMWLLAGYNVDLRGKHILLIGRGKLVGAPLEKLFKASGLDVSVVADSHHDLKSLVEPADVIITATGQHGVVSANMLKPGAVVVDAGVASEEGKTVGDLAPDVYQRDDITVTPTKGGVGPLTVCALFENVIRAAQASLKSNVAAK